MLYDVIINFHYSLINHQFFMICRMIFFEKISVQEIANKSGYNRSTFYQYFPDIYELLDSVENELLNDIKKELANKELSMHTVQDKLYCLDSREHLLVLNALIVNNVFLNIGKASCSKHSLKKKPTLFLHKTGSGSVSLIIAARKSYTEPEQLLLWLSFQQGSR